MRPILIIWSSQSVSLLGSSLVQFALIRYLTITKMTEEILNFIQLSCEVFDELTSALLPGYTKRGSLLYPSIDAAKQASRQERLVER